MTSEFIAEQTKKFLANNGKITSCNSGDKSSPAFLFRLTEVLCGRCYGKGYAWLSNGKVGGKELTCFACDGFGELWLTSDQTYYKKGTLPKYYVEHTCPPETVDPDYFWAHVSDADENGCRLWMGDTNKAGYGFCPFSSSSKNAHRVAWVLTHGPISLGLELDHYRLNSGEPCSKLCVVHVEPVTKKVNIQRSLAMRTEKRAARTHCKHGHEMTDDNWTSDRRCLTCRKLRDRLEYQLSKKKG